MLVHTSLHAFAASLLKIRVFGGRKGQLNTSMDTDSLVLNSQNVPSDFGFIDSYQTLTLPTTIRERVYAATTREYSVVKSTHDFARRHALATQYGHSCAIFDADPENAGACFIVPETIVKRNRDAVLGLPSVVAVLKILDGFPAALDDVKENYKREFGSCYVSDVPSVPKNPDFQTIVSLAAIMEGLVSKTLTLLPKDGVPLKDTRRCSSTYDHCLCAVLMALGYAGLDRSEHSNYTFWRNQVTLDGKTQIQPGSTFDVAWLQAQLAALGFDEAPAQITTEDDITDAASAVVASLAVAALQQSGAALSGAQNIKQVIGHASSALGQIFST